MMNITKKPKAKVVIILVLLLLIIVVGFWIWNRRIDHTLIGDEVTITRVVDKTEKTTGAYVTVSYTRDSDAYRFANVSVDFNKDSEIAAYQTENGSQEEWIVQNIPARTFAVEGSSFSFQLRDLTAESRNDFPASVILTKETLNEWDGQTVSSSAVRTTTVPSITSDDMSPRFTLHPEGKTGASFAERVLPPAFAQDEQIPNMPPVDGESDTAKTGEGQGQAGKEKTIETLSKEFDVFNGDVPDITQGKNECAPTSITNSLLWLAKKNKFTDKMPKTPQEVIGELKGDLKWAVNKGVDDKDFIPGKEAFTKRHNIPIETHRVNVKDYDINIMAKIAQELRKGQDVEVGIEYWRKQANGKWKVVGGHWMTAVGATGTKDSQTLFVHDPLSPGPSLLDIYKVDGTKIIDYRYQGESLTYIQYAVAESPVLTPVITSAVTSVVPTAPTVKSSPAPPAASPTITTTTKPSAVSPAVSPTTATPPSDEVDIMSEFESLMEESIRRELGIYVTPRDTKGLSIQKAVFNLSPVGSTPSSYTLNINMRGWQGEAGAIADWSCSLSGNTYTCQGQTALATGKKSVFYFYFADVIPTLPSSVAASLYAGGNKVADLSIKPKK